MVYIPGPGAKNNLESIKKSNVKKANEKEAEKESIPIQKTEAKSQKKQKEKTIKPDKKIEKSKKPKKVIHNAFFLYLLMGISVFFSIAAFLKMYDTEKLMRNRLDAMSSKYNSWYQEIQQKSDETYEMLKPNGWLNQVLLSANLIEDYIIGVDDIINIAQEGNFSNVGFCRLFISGNSPVWISVEGNSKTIFGKNISPGLSDEQFFYYKQPKVTIEDKTIIVPKNFKITSGNFENTYILFFNFGTTKLVKMNARSINNVPSAFDIWLP
ncbi:MAG: hypothetical protein PWQ84_22 [Thermotogaceae bacterium]|jgi:hypothetical protein|nr:hypothetical protein [Thermotogaceae bacterium]